MKIARETLYRFPWSKTDNPGGWVEVTDKCDLFCPGCYRHTLEGHRALEEVKKDILECQRLTNCDRMAIAGGEPLIYPHILEVVNFIAKQGMKPLLLTNGQILTRDMIKELKKAGLAMFQFHVDSGQGRPGWIGKTETEMNELRQYFADMVFEIGGLQCGFNITIFRSSLKYLPELISWCRKNIAKVQHVSIVAFRAIPLMEEIKYVVDGRVIDAHQFQHTAACLDEINLSTDEMYALIRQYFDDFRPCAYLNGTVAPETYKFLITINIGSKKEFYGLMGAKSVEFVQMFYHFFKGKYLSFVRNPAVGKKILLLFLIDRELRSTLGHFLRAGLRNPLKFMQKLYVQSISLQQPNEYYEGESNECDGCLNMMIYKGKLIPSCRLDEYRMAGGPLRVEKIKMKGQGS